MDGSRERPAPDLVIQRSVASKMETAGSNPAQVTTATNKQQTACIKIGG